MARYREELRRHTDQNAMALALHRAGPAIIASAATVAAGMLCLSIAEMNATKGLGPVAALVGLAATGGVITSAGLVLAGTFAALGSLVP